jgi:hypothetical protein
MTRSVMASRLPIEVSVAGRRVAVVVRLVAVEVDLVETDFVDAVFFVWRFVVL